MHWCAGLHRETILVLEICDTYATQSIHCVFDTLSKIIWIEIQDTFYVWKILTFSWYVFVLSKNKTWIMLLLHQVASNMFCEWTFIKERMSKWLREIKIILFIIYVVFIKAGVYFAPIFLMWYFRCVFFTVAFYMRKEKSLSRLIMYLYFKVYFRNNSGWKGPQEVLSLIYFKNGQLCGQTKLLRALSSLV